MDKFKAVIVANDGADLMEELTELAYRFAVLKTHIAFDVIDKDIVALCIDEYNVVVYACYKDSDESTINAKSVNLWWNKCRSHAVGYLFNAYAPGGEVMCARALIDRVVEYCTRVASKKASGNEYYVQAMVNVRNDDITSGGDFPMIRDLLKNISEQTNGVVTFKEIRIINHADYHTRTAHEARKREANENKNE